LIDVFFLEDFINETQTMSQNDDQSGGDAIWCVKNGDINGLKDHLKTV